MSHPGLPSPLGHSAPSRGQYLPLGLQLLLVLVAGVSWDLPSPERDSNYGVGDAHDEQRKAVHQDDDDHVVPANNKENSVEESRV